VRAPRYASGSIGGGILPAVSDDRGTLLEEIERLRAERDQLLVALSDSREQLQIAFDYAPAAIAVVSILQARYAYVNRAFSEFFGADAAEILRSDPFQWTIAATHPEDFEADRKLFQRLADGEIASYELEKRYLVKGGQTRWGLLSITGARDSGGRLSYVVTHITDIHEKKTAAEARARLEDRLRQSQKLEALGQLAGGIAHDFNNRLVVVMAYIELLRLELPPDSHLLEYADQILISAQRSAELTRQLLAFSRHQVLSPKSFDIHQTLDGMRRMLQRLLGERVELVTVFGAKRPVYCDPGQLEQVIMNLAVNARDAMPEGGRLTFETRDADRQPDDLRPGEYVVLAVSDTGMGIPEEMLPRIFEPFFTTKGVVAGTGLGLATVDGIVRQSGGGVSVSSKVGRGSTFTVYLPAANLRAAAAEEKVVAAPVRPVRTETVLLCDDEDSVRRILSDVLQMAGYRVLEARDGMQALEVARAYQGQIDILVTDVVMPRLEGPELARRLRATNPTLAILFISGWAESASAREMVVSEGEFLAKPFLPGDLVRSVVGALERRSTLPAPLTADQS
jgi:two-component system, cell cycle sensor histidine kinase and response regulator CckA